MRPRPAISRRGSVGLAMVIVLVILQLVIVGVVVSGARDQNLSVNRMDSARAGYAAEAGANMALRELMNDADEDGDGTIGSISNDGNPANDPALGTARVYVIESVAGLETTLTVRGRAGSALRQASLLTEYGASGGGPTLAAFSRSGSGLPRYSRWNGSAWGANTAMPDIGAEANHVVLRNCPARTEVMYASQDDFQNVNVTFFNGSSWGSVTQVCTNTGETTNRAFDAAYEQTSGDGLIVYWKDSSDQVGYRTWNGTTVSSESLLSLSGASDANTLALFSRPGSNAIILLAQNYSGANRLSAAVWSGSAWGSWTHLITGLETSSTECFSLAFESRSRHALVVYTEGGNSSPRYRTWNGSKWSSQSSMPSMGDPVSWYRLAADPASSTILLAAMENDEDITVNRWNGSSWGSNMQIETEAGAPDHRRFDLAFGAGGTSALVVYCDKNSDRPQYRTWNGSAWGSEQQGPDLNGPIPHGIFVTSGAVSGQIFIAVKDDAKDIHLMQWNGSSIPGKTTIETTYGGPDETEQVMIVSSTGAPTPRLVSWYFVAPQ